MKMVIVAKTKMPSNDCVGAITQSGQFVRLLDEDGNNQPENCQFEIGQIWDIEFDPKPNCKLPHTEDVLIRSRLYTQKLVSKQSLVKWILKRFTDRIWYGSPDMLFAKTLRFTSNGSGYIRSENKTLNYSVGFWIADSDLARSDYQGKIKYSYPLVGYWRLIPYVGRAKSIETIVAGTLMRVSLARWWSPDDDELEKRCYLQLSGWYLD